jgi:hypothetical protein
MPVYHFTEHAYRSWRPDHPRGYTKKGIGYLPSDDDAADEYDNAAAQDPLLFDEKTQREVLALVYQICEEEGWRLEGAGFDPTHAHLAISWREYRPWEEGHRRLKNLLTLKLNRRHETPGKRWFARRHGAPRRVRHMKHLRYLVRTYFPDHPGFFWSRGMPVPVLD